MRQAPARIRVTGSRRRVVTDKRLAIFASRFRLARVGKGSGVRGAADAAGAHAMRAPATAHGFVSVNVGLR